MATITKKDLVERISEETQQTQVLTKRIIQSFLDAIVSELAAGNRLEFREFGVFETRERRSRRARNPRTGEHVEVDAKRVVSFKAGRTMKNRVESTAGDEQPSTEQGGAPAPQRPPGDVRPPLDARPGQAGSPPPERLI